jgi:hypothetical protein
MARNRIIYASQSVWINGEVMYRVQSCGSSSTLTSEDVYELGHLDLIDVVDDVPQVAITLNTNEFGDVRTIANLSQVSYERREMNATASGTNYNLQVVDSNLAPIGVPLHGVCLADFAVTCGNLEGVTMWTPVQDECSIGTLANNIDQTQYIDNMFINSLEFSYAAGSNATENYGAESDSKMWLLNDGRFVNFDSFTLDATDVTNGYVDLTLATADDIAVLSDGIGFLRKDYNGNSAVSFYDTSNNSVDNVRIVTGTAAAANDFVYHNTGTEHRVYFPTAVTQAVSDRIEIIYAANAYGTGTSDTYFRVLSDQDRPDSIGALRQGQVEVYMVPEDATAFNIAWRLTSTSISCDLTREPLQEIGHLGPYDRPLTLPIPITISTESTAGDLEAWARSADLLAEFNAGTLDDIDLADLMASEDMKLVVMIYAQTDEEANGTAETRTVSASSDLIGQNYLNNGVLGTYSAGDREFPLKTLVVGSLKATSENQSLDVGSNATLSMEFRSSNDLSIVKGGIDITDITNGNSIARVA